MAGLPVLRYFFTIARMRRALVEPVTDGRHPALRVEAQPERVERLQQHVAAPFAMIGAVE